MKLRLLNGSHSTLAYLGFLAGPRVHLAGVAPIRCSRTLIERHDGRGDRADARARRRASISPRTARSCCERFRNPALPHRTRQIAMDGSQKLPQRLLGTVRDRLAARRVDRASRARGRRLDPLRERHRRAGQRRSTSPIRWRRRSRRSPRDARRRPGRDRRRLPRPRERVRRRSGRALRRSARRCARNVGRAVPRRRARDARAHLRHRLATSTRGPTWPIPLEPPSRPAVPRRPRHARPRAPRSTRRSRTCRSSARTATPIRSGSPTTRRSPNAVRAVHHARPLRVPHALQPGRARSRTSAFRARDGGAGRDATRARSGARFAAHYHLFRGTPTRLWLDHAFADGVRHRRAADAANRPTAISTASTSASRKPEFRPRALFERFNIEVIATTEIAARSARRITRRSARPAGRAAWSPPTGPIRSSIPSSRAFAHNVAQFGELTGEDTATWQRLSRGAPPAPRALQDAWARRRPITAIRRRAPCDLAAGRVPSGCSTARSPARSPPDEAELFRGQMLTEMARMSLDDGLVMQIHPGSFRNHNPRRLRALRPRQGRRHPDAAPTTSAR